MARGIGKPVNIVSRDGSSYRAKKQLIESSGYFRRTRWERATVIDVLDQNSEYLDYLTEDKLYFDFQRDLSPFGHNIESTLYTDTRNNDLVFATVAHRKDVVNGTSANMQYIDGTSESENFVFSSVFSNRSTSTETGRGGNPITVLQSIQLFRYDPTGGFKHPNSQDIYNHYQSAYGTQVADFYRSFFEEEVGFPHFHFSNRLMSETYDKTGEADAISLDKLIEYVECLMRENDKNHVLNNIDFGMPYLRIKKNPTTYKTAVDYRALREALRNNTVNKQVAKIFKNIEKLSDDVTVLHGLEAVFSDLVLLKILRSGDTGLARLDRSHPPEPSGGDYLAFIGGDKSSTGKKYELRNNEFYEEPLCEVSMAELQTASKIASAGGLCSKSSKGTDKLHFDEAVYSIDGDTEKLLGKVYCLCMNQKNKTEGGEYGPNFQ